MLQPPETGSWEKEKRSAEVIRVGDYPFSDISGDILNCDS